MGDVRLSMKLAGAFVLAAIITLAVGVEGWRGVSRLSGHLQEVTQDHLPAIQNLLALEKGAEIIRMAQRTLLSPNLDGDTRRRQYENVVNARNFYEKARESYENLPRSTEADALWKQFALSWGALRAENDEFFRLSKELDAAGVRNPTALMRDLAQFRGDHLSLLVQTEELIQTGTEFSGGEDSAECAFGRWMAAFHSEDVKINDTLKKMASIHDSFHRSVQKIKGSVSRGGSQAASAVYRQEVLPASRELIKDLGALKEEARSAESIYRKMEKQTLEIAREKEKTALELLEQLIEMSEKEAEEAGRSSSADAKRAKIIATIGMVAGSLVALILGGALGVIIIRPVNRVSGGLHEASEQVAAASGQVASASQRLAECTSQQASAIEETSASLEEMASMTKRNAENAAQADRIMSKAGGIVDEANSSMKRLTASMREISAASEETQNIVRTIDEISFQTNLLALNAAVEAARAGEAGAGFAVVADEVRNLALRAADAAKSTAGLIEKTVKCVKDGESLVETTNSDFEEVAASVAMSGRLLGEIAVASNEQAQGISQVNKAVAELDKVTQQNAANAEQSASASEEMNAQAERMRGFSRILTAMVKGGRNNEAESGGPIPEPVAAIPKPGGNGKTVPVRRNGARVPPHASVSFNGAAERRIAHGPRRPADKVRPEDVIPFDEDQGLDF